MFRQIPVIEVNRDNFATFWPSILLTVKNSSFLAVDVELSGLGDRKTLNAKSIDDRYKSIAEAASSRAVLSLGLSCFKESKDEDDQAQNGHVFKTQTYNFLTLCENEFMVEPDALQFLVDHGFDFNLQYAKGLSYRRGSPKANDSDTRTLRVLIKEILVARKPIVVHNGLVDLIFLYGNFVADLPTSLQSFVADVAELFPGGVYDTKFVADFCARYSASYLEYVFRKCQRGNEAEAKSGRPYIDIRMPTFTPNIERWVEWAACNVPETRSASTEIICPVFAEHGWCKQGRLCPMSHDVDAVLDLEEAKQEKKRAKKRRRRNGPEKDAVDESMEVQEPIRPSNGSVAKSLPLYTGAHRSGYDAFMTGFSFLYLAMKLNQWPPKEERTDFEIAMFKNKIALSGKDYPLFIQRSAFAKMSQNVQEYLKV